MLMNQIFECDNANEAFNHWYKILDSMNEESESRDGEVVGEIINAITVLKDPTRGLASASKIRKLSVRYAFGELLWYISGNNHLSEIQKFGSGWDKMSDDGITVNSNYGYCIQNKYGFDQWEYVRHLLREKPETRQAIIHIKDASNVESKDVNCTIALQFFIRDGKLHLTSFMRSNDIWLGFPFDVFQFCCMQILMSMELGIPLGTYTHVSGSLHLYKRNAGHSNLENERDD